MTKRAVLYARVSGDDRGKEGRNLAGQLAMGREYAQKRDYQIVAELSEDDRGASGAEIDLPQLERVLDLAEAGEFDVLIVRELDRLSRNIAKQLTIETELKRHGIDIEYILGEYPDTPEGRLNKHIRASIAEFEREQITLRMVRGRRQKVKAGSVLVSKRPPYGYIVKEEDHRRFSLELYEPEAKIVELIFKWYIEGDGETGPMEINSITRKLTAMGVPSPADSNWLKGGGQKKRGRCEWNRAAVHYMLKNETYAGIWHFGKRNGRKKLNNHPENRIAIEVPALVDQDTWKKAQERLDYNRRNGTRSLKYQYLLRGRLKCGKCLSAMAGNPSHSRGRPYIYYRCCAAGHDLRYVRQCDGKWFRVSDVDDAVWNWVSAFLSDSATLYKSLTAVQSDHEREVAPFRQRLSVIDGLLDDHRRQLQRLVDLYLSGDFEKDVLTDRKSRLESTIQALEREQSGVAAMLEKRTMSDERVQSILTFADGQKDKVELATRSFEVRRTLIEELNVKATLIWENGEPIVYASCILGEESFRAASHTLSGI